MLHAAVVQAVNEVYAQRDAYLPQLKANIEKVLSEDNSGPVAEVDAKIADLETFFGEFDGEVTEYDDSLVRRLIGRITVYDDHFTVEFKSGIEVDVAL